MRAALVAGLLFVVSAGPAFPSDPKEKPGKTDKPQKPVKKAPVKAGIKTPGVQVPFENLKALAEVPVAGNPGTIVVGEKVWVVDQPKDSLLPIDGKTNKANEPIAGFHKPCSGAAIGFGSLWVPNCGDQTIARVDLKTSKITATLPIGAADVRNGIAISADSAWILTDNKTTLSRVDPETNQVVSQMRLAAGCDHILFAETALWVTCPEQNKIIRIDPQTNLVVTRIEVSAKPHSLAAGEGSVFALCTADGKVERIDPKTNKVSNTIDLAVPGADGNIAVGDGFIWATLTGFPLSRIDPATNKVVQQFVGDGGGFLASGLGSLWMSNGKPGNVWRIDPKRVIATLAE
jgi:virginiamycin B lyase